MIEHCKETEKRVRSTIARLLIPHRNSVEGDVLYGNILLKLRHKQIPIGTFATDGRQLIYDPEMAKECDDAEMHGVLRHEARHILQMHFARKGTRDMNLWRIACDIEVNQIEQNFGGVKLPEGCIPGEPGTAEEHYQRLQQEQQDGGGGCGKGNSWCEIQETELGAGESADEVQYEIESIVRSAITETELAGQIPAGMREELKDFLRPKVNWKVILSNFVETTKSYERSWAKPNRRWIHKGLILPGDMPFPNLPELAFAVDTSGSISSQELLQVTSEVAHVIRDCYDDDITLPVVWFDHAAYLDFVEESSELVPKGGGGTRFSAVMECVRDNELDIEGLVIVTDGFCGDFGEPPDVPVLWCVFDNGYNFSPPFGDVVRVTL